MPEFSGIELPSLRARLISHASLGPVSRGSSSSRFLSKIELGAGIGEGIGHRHHVLPILFSTVLTSRVAAVNAPATQSGSRA
jgi:hypothetical protein